MQISGFAAGRQSPSALNAPVFECFILRHLHSFRRPIPGIPAAARPEGRPALVDAIYYSISPYIFAPESRPKKGTYFCASPWAFNAAFCFLRIRSETCMRYSRIVLQDRREPDNEHWLDVMNANYSPVPGGGIFVFDIRLISMDAWTIRHLELSRKASRRICPRSLSCISCRASFRRLLGKTCI